MGDVRIIIDGPPEAASDVLAAILERRADLDTCKTGWGWGIVSAGRWGAFIRRTRGGYSAKVRWQEQSQ